MPVVEIASFVASEALLADHDLLKGALEHVSKVNGFISAYAGVQVEDKKTTYLAVVWETYEAHKALMDSPEYPALIEKLKPGLGGPLVMNHVPFNEDVTNALSAPTTEVITSKLKDPQAKDPRLDESAAFFTKALSEAVGAHPPVVYGESKENPGTLIVLIGWDSVEAHLAARAKDPRFKEYAAKAADFTDATVVHVNFEKRS
ncbi:uncharacterized protein LACBIDRAFT_292588 [Laccaria bicolor S238N-H82]|uniref:Predicted protein n=1 Tax=Laccaria bicolor (strain S238N-H82 / ATCC MYA-4686) TaxID=486041 RepID=B0CVR9_LACBS|nr:uncharacterized protein LACBIDRAFT_292588 [Laccaria bicolor S238N-H82]EDR13795.1 predicted protein [Laccaria bicolor S238N-H82]|eukprot:XP_001876293.1 predicted protein [Laccaria bicolor S238N-H82]